MKWIKLTQETFKDLKANYDENSAIVIVRDYTKDFGNPYYIYSIYNYRDFYDFEYLIDDYDYYYLILERPNK